MTLRHDAAGELFNGLFLIRRWCARHGVGLDGARFIIELPTGEEMSRAKRGIRLDADQCNLIVIPNQRGTTVKALGFELKFRLLPDGLNKENEPT